MNVVIYNTRGRRAHTDQRSDYDSRVEGMGLEGIHPEVEDHPVLLHELGGAVSWDVAHERENGREAG